VFTSASVGSLLGPPLAGLLLGVSGGYLLPAVVTAAVAALGAVGQVFLPPTTRTLPR